MKKAVLNFAIGLVAVAPALQGAEFLVFSTDDSLGGVYIGEGYVRTAGYEFAVGNLPLSVTALGVRDWFGNGVVNSHEIGVWDADRNLLAQITVPPGPGTNGFRYAELTSPLLLAAGELYVVGATYVHMDADRIGYSDPRNGDSPVYNSVVTFQQIRFDDDQFGITFPDLVGYPEEMGLFGPNVQFDIVPEPSTKLLLCLGVGLIFVHRRLGAKGRQRRCGKYDWR